MLLLPIILSSTYCMKDHSECVFGCIDASGFRLGLQPQNDEPCVRVSEAEPRQKWSSQKGCL